MKATLLLLLFNAGFCISIMAQPRVEPAFEMLAPYPNVRDFSLSPKGDEAYFTMQSLTGEISVIVCMKKESGTWKTPEIVNFSGRYKDLEPFVSPDGLRLYFASNRPLAESAGSSKDFDIWYVERDAPGKAWGEPVNPGPPVNTPFDEFYPSVSANGNLYFTSNGEGTRGEDDIFFSPKKGEKFAPPVSLPESINSAGYEFNAFIDPTESYLIFSGFNREDGQGSGDLYISFRNTSGTWEPAQNLGEKINSKYLDYCPFVDTQTRVLYFTSRRFLPGQEVPFGSIEQLHKELSKYENGMSRLYKVSIDSFIKQ